MKTNNNISKINNTQGNNIYKIEINELLKKLVKRKDSEESKPRTLLKKINCYNQYIQLSKSQKNSKSKSNNITISSNNIHKVIFKNENVKLKELCSILNNCSKEEYSESNSMHIEKILKLIKTYSNLDDIIKNQLIVTDLGIIINKYIFRKHKYKICDVNQNSIENFPNFFIDEIIFQEDSMFKIKDIYWKDILNIYEIISIFINFSVDNIKFIDESFLKGAFGNISSYDSEERFIIKILIHKLYGNSFKFRKIIIKKLEDKLLDILYSSKLVADIIGVNDVLELCICILNGLNKPIKKNFINFIRNNILPLIKNKFVKNYWDNLKKTLIALFDLDISIAESIINFTTLKWPFRFPDRILIHLELFEYILNEKYELLNKCKALKKLLHKVVSCISDTNFLISDKSLVLFKNEKFLQLCFNNHLEIKILDRLIKNTKEHWSEEIVMLSKLVISRLNSYDKELLSRIDEEKRNYLKDINFSAVNEELWNFRFDLKAD